MAIGNRATYLAASKFLTRQYITFQTVQNQS